MLPIVLFLLVSLLSLGRTDPIYITPNKLCSSECTGSLINPFDNLLDALQYIKDASSATIVFLHNPDLPHYVFNPNASTTINTASYSTVLQFTFQDLTIQPLYCTDDIVQTNSSLLDWCIELDSQLIVYLKTTKFRLNIAGNLHLRNIEFNAVENIFLWNQPSSSDLNNCLYSKTQCCSSGSPHTLTCEWSHDYSSLSVIASNSLFVFPTTSSASTRSLVIEDSTFKNFLTPDLLSLVRIDSPPFNVFFNRSLLTRVYFDRGLIYQPKNSSAISTNNVSQVVIQDSTFSYYNVWSMQYQSSARNEGYLLNSQTVFPGVLSLKNSSFYSFTSSLRTSCWPQTTQYYNLPMNNLLNSDPRSRTNLWNQYHSEKGSANDYISSLIYIKQLNGSVLLSKTTFKNITGTSGSVLRVDDIISVDNWFTTYDCTFENNFAYDRFANIMISKSSNPLLSECPFHEIANTTFKSTTGCPGAYGNVLLLCYWDSQPPKSSLSNYAFDDTSPLPTRILIKDSTFSNNSLAVSNSLAIIGSSSAVLENNIFQYNGGSTAQIATSLIASSFILPSYPSTLTHFGQSTAVYFDHFISLKTHGNTFQSNYGPWEGSLSLASALTLKNWLKLEDSLTLSSDKFLDHQGVPSEISKFLTDKTINNYMDPLITISVDLDGTSQLTSNPQINSIFNNITFSRNKLAFNSTSYQYNSNQLGTLFTNWITQDYRYTTGLVRVLYTSEAVDDFSYGFKEDDTDTPMALTFHDGIISQNEIIGMGCLLMDASLVENLQVTSNIISKASEVFTESQDYTKSYQMSPGSNNQGVFCVGNSPLGSQTLTINNLFVSKNTGIIINLFPNNLNPPSVSLMNSIFTENSCTALSIIAIRSTANFAALNNIFLKNSNSVGILYSHNNANPSISITNIYLSNTGKYASLAYLDGSINYEGFTIAKWNTVQPKYKVFAEGTAPQAALYFTNAAIFLSFRSQYTQNLGYSGLIITYGGETTFFDSIISQHQITGSAIVGNFMSLSHLQMNNVSLLDNKIIFDSNLPNLNTAHIVLYTSTFNASNVNFTRGTTSGGAYLIYADITTGIVNNFVIQDFYRLDSGYQPLFYTTSSTWTISNFQCSNSTGLFKVVGSQFALNTASISSLTTKYKSQFLFGLSATYLNITNLKYYGLQQNSASDISLFSGNKVDLRMSNSQFYNMNGDTNVMFNLRSFLKILVAHCLFQNNRNLVQNPVFYLQTGPYVAIHSSTFVFCGPVFKVSGVTKSVYFTGNTLITNSHAQTFSLESNTALIYIIANQFLRQNNNAALASTFPTSQLKILDSNSPTQDVLIQDNQFISLYGQTGIVMIIGGTSPYAVNLKNNVFINNIASSDGGALYLQTNTNSSRGDIQNCAFIRNNASAGKGGAIYQASPNLLPQNTTISSSIFVKNSASVTGGAIFFDYSLPNIVTENPSTFLKNQAKRPNNIGSYPVQLVFSHNTVYNDTLYIPGLIPFQPNTSLSDNSHPIQISNIGSGVPTNDHLAFVLLDMFGQRFDSDDTSVLQIYPSGYTTTIERSSFSTQISLQAASGMYILEDFTFNYRVNESLLVTFASSAIPMFSIIPVTNLTFSPNISVEFSFRFCGRGEFIIKEEGYISCQECPAGYWQLESSTSALACTACDSVSTYCFGGSNIGPKPGYWRMNEKATLVLECPLKAACIGNALSRSTSDATEITLDPLGKCADLRQGNLCDQCVPGWAKNSNGQCIQCSKNALPYFLLFVLMSIQVGLIAYSVGTTIESGNKYSTTSKSELEGSPLMRILMNYSQIFALLLTIPISWPITIESVLSVSAEVPAASQELFSIDCFYNLGRERFGSYVLFLRVLFVTTTPYALIVFAFIFWIFYFLFKKIPIIGNKEFGYRVITTIVIICFERQSEVIQSAFTMFKCKNLYRQDNPKYFLEEEYDVECWKSTHFKWVSILGLPTLGIWVLALPIFITYVLWRNKTKLSDLKIAKKYSFIYNGYHNNRFYWEIVLIVRKILFVCNVVFTRFVNVQIYISLVLILGSYFLQELCKPYVKEELNKLERVALISLGILNLCGLYFQIGEAYVDLDIMLIIMAFGSNIIFICYFIKLLFAVNREKMMKNKKFASAFRFIQKHCACLMRLNCMKNLHNELNVFEGNSEAPPQSPTDSLSVNKNSGERLNMPPSRYERPKFSSFILTPVNMSLKNENENEGQDNENMIMSPLSDNLYSDRQFIFRSDEDLGKETDRNLMSPNLKSSNFLKIPMSRPENLLNEGRVMFGSDEDREREIKVSSNQKSSMSDNLLSERQFIFVSEEDPDKETDPNLIISNFKSSNHLMKPIAENLLSEGQFMRASDEEEEEKEKETDRDRDFVLPDFKSLYNLNQEKDPDDLDDDDDEK